jgi:hypothetical protein
LWRAQTLQDLGWVVGALGRGRGEGADGGEGVAGEVEELVFVARGNSPRSGLGGGAAAQAGVRWGWHLRTAVWGWST